MGKYKYKLPYCSNRIITPCVVDVSKYVHKNEEMLDDDMRFCVNAIEAPLITTDVLIGMDIIVQGDFCLERRNDDQILRFEI